MQIRTYPYPQCHLCGSKGEWLYKELTDQLFGVAGKWNLKICTNPVCGLVWLDPMPVSEDIGKLYQSYHTHGGPHFPKKDFKYLVKSVLKALLARIPGANRQRWLSINQILQAHPPGRLLDVGCGNGRFIQEMKTCGWEVEGVDFDPKAIDKMRKQGLTVYAGDLRDIAYAQDTFDAITLSHVIEHLFNPIEILTECKRILRPGGQLVVVTPNINSWGQRRFKRHWRGLEPPRHLFLFSPRTLETIANKAGFDVQQVFSTVRNTYIFSASLRLEKLSQNAKPSRFVTNKWILLFYEWLLMYKHPDSGEIAVLLATKQ
jgi:2-polyprenyl-3-methyl-5-hydroxy-6-metoxy-1,4-benzoquinol methylase